ncbi:MAG: REP-associated tyrosine transposase, partial [Chloroflexota bacterium]
MTHQPQLIRDEPTPYQAARETERAEYLERLREKLKDPEFRAIEGFPLGEDEDILALSDPPTYTVCPNPFLPEILARWQAERAQLRQELGLPDDTDDNGDSLPLQAGEGPGMGVYRREPFAADVSEGKNDPIYNAHSYHTKVPHKAVMRYILHYTDPGDVVFDGFCGTGMTGVAAQLCGDKKTVESLGYRVNKDGTILDERDQTISRLGVRKAALVDLSPAATFIAYNYNTPVDAAAFEREAQRILREVEAECGWMYETWHVEPASCRLIQKIIEDKCRDGILPSPEGILPSPEGRMPSLQGITEFTIRQGDLPHWQLPGAHYFITFNTASQRQLSPAARDVVLSALQFWNGQRLDLIAAVVMPDHVHAILSPLEKQPGVYWDLSVLMHSVKSYSANEINQVENRRGETVWQSETYDHIVRNPEEYHRILSYIAHNPVKAGLAVSPWDYEWFWLHGGFERAGWKPAPQGKINYTVWSDVFVCPECGREMVFWDVAVDKETGQVRDAFPCPGCGAEQSKRTLERAWETVFDRALNQTVRRARQVPVLINYSVGMASVGMASVGMASSHSTARSRRYEKTPDADDLALIRRIEESDIPYWFPTDRMPEGDESHRNDDIGITHVHHFYTQRNLWVLAALWQRLYRANPEVRNLLRFCFTASLRAVTKLASIAFSYYFRGGGGPINAGTKGTLYISSTIPEVQVIRSFSDRSRTLAKLFRSMSQSLFLDDAVITLQSATSLVGIADSTIDYVFVDPPFGGNLMYSELSFYWETWLRTPTNSEPEAVVNQTQRKGLLEYQHLMEGCFREFYRILKPGRWMTVEFHNSQNRVWNAIQEAILRSGFVIADVRSLDKKQGSFKQYTSTAAVKQDLIISAYKPRTGFERRFLEQAGSTEGAWAFVRQHLAQLPVVVERRAGILPATPSGKMPDAPAMEVVVERRAGILPAAPSGKMPATPSGKMPDAPALEVVERRAGILPATPSGKMPDAPAMEVVVERRAGILPAAPSGKM